LYFLSPFCFFLAFGFLFNCIKDVLKIKFGTPFLFLFIVLGFLVSFISELSVLWEALLVCSIQLILVQSKNTLT
jgi:hypothetical protein